MQEVVAALGLLYGGNRQVVVVVELRHEAEVVWLVGSQGMTLLDVAVVELRRSPLGHIGVTGARLLIRMMI